MRKGVNLSVPALICWAVLGSLVVYEILFNQRVWGLNVAVLYVYFLAVVVLSGARPRRYALREPVVLCGLGVIALLIEPTLLSNGLAWTALFMAALQRRHAVPFSLSVLLLRLAAAWSRFPALLRRDTVTLRVRAPRLIGSARDALHTIRQWALIVVALVPFIILFSFSNPLTSQFFGELQRWVGDGVHTALTRALLEGQVVGWLAVSLTAWALLRIRGSARVSLKVVRALDQRVQPEPMQLVRFLAASNLLFLSQNVLDAFYLIGHRGVLPPGFTFAEYAHRGAYPLVGTVLLAALFILYLFQPGRDAVRLRTPRLLVGLWLFQNLLLLLSAAYRLQIYVEVYQLSRFRFAAFVWMGVVAIGLCLTGMRIARSLSNRWLVEWNLRVVAGVLLWVAVFNVDSAVAWYNVEQRRSRLGSRQVLDLPYLLSLAPASLPALTFYARCRPVDSALQGTIRWEEHRFLAEHPGWRGATVRAWTIRNALERAAKRPCQEVRNLRPYLDP